MRILGIETSSVRGSVALVDNGRTIGSATHSRQNAHGESIQPLIDDLLRRAAWDKRAIERIAVGVGPGSFTGLRVGIALAAGIAEGLGIEVVGVGSLAAMALAQPLDSSRIRCAVLDARREEVFVAAYRGDGEEILAPVAWSRHSALQQLREAMPHPFEMLGLGCDLLGVEEQVRVRGEALDLPHAAATARLGQKLVPTGPVTPTYVRDSVATLPQLPPNPLLDERR